MDGNLNNFLDQVLGLEYSEYMTDFENMTKKQFINWLVSAALNVVRQFPTIESIRWVQSKPYYDHDDP